MINMQVVSEIALGFMYLLESSYVIQLTVCTEEIEIVQIFRRVDASWISGGEYMSTEDAASTIESKVASAVYYEIKVFNQERVMYKH